MEGVDWEVPGSRSSESQTTVAVFRPWRGLSALIPRRPAIGTIKWRSHRLQASSHTLWCESSTGIRLSGRRQDRTIAVALPRVLSDQLYIHPDDRHIGYKMPWTHSRLIGHSNRQKVC